MNTGHRAILISEGTRLANGPMTPTKDVAGTTAAMNEFTRRILAVPYSRIKAALDGEKPILSSILLAVIPCHRPIKTGTLAGILKHIAAHHGITVGELLAMLDL